MFHPPPLLRVNCHWCRLPGPELRICEGNLFGDVEFPSPSDNKGGVTDRRGPRLEKSTRRTWASHRRNDGPRRDLAIHAFPTHEALRRIARAAPALGQRPGLGSFHCIGRPRLAAIVAPERREQRRLVRARSFEGVGPILNTCSAGWRSDEADPGELSSRSSRAGAAEAGRSPVVYHLQSSFLCWELMQLDCIHADQLPTAAPVAVPVTLSAASKPSRTRPPWWSTAPRCP